MSYACYPKYAEALDALRDGLPTITDVDSDGHDEELTLVSVLLSTDDEEKHIGALLTLLRTDVTPAQVEAVRLRIAKAIGSYVDEHMESVAKDCDYARSVGEPA